MLTNLVGNNISEYLRLLGSGSRFNAITRGIIDLRDFYYYISLTIVFLLYNIYTLEKQRWSFSKDKKITEKKPLHGLWKMILFAGCVNALLANVWFNSVHSLRFDVTDGKIFSISDVTKRFVAQLQEPLLIRGYFSEKTHPLLAPLVPQIKDLLREYEVAGRGKIRVEFVDPASNADIESEAMQKYGIKPVPFQVADRHQTALVNSYFTVLIQYGDQYQTLGFNDLIEVKTQAENQVDVQLRNPEYDITRAIKKALLTYQSGGNILSMLKSPITFTGYVSAREKLPQNLAAFLDTLVLTTSEFEKKGGNNFIIKMVQPESNNNAVASQIEKDYGFRPMATDIFSPDHFYFYMTLTDGKQVVQVGLPEDLSEATLKRNMETAIKRFAQGFNKTIGLVTPVVENDENPYQQYQGQRQPQSEFNQLRKTLSENYTVEDVDLDKGVVPGNIDMLMVVAPKDLSQKSVFAIDQYLMQGGTVFAATSPFSVNISQQGFNAQPQKSGLEDWLKNLGITLDEKLVMDSQNSPFPAPVIRQVGNMRIQEMRLIDYPYLVDVRGDGLNNTNPVTTSLPQLTVAWSSPIQLQKDDSANKKTEGEKKSHSEILAHSSVNSWLGGAEDIMPKLNPNGQSAYAPTGEQKSYDIAVVKSGLFESFFKDKESPLFKLEKSASVAEMQSNTNSNAVFSGVIAHSAESARLILVSSSDFLKDNVIGLSGATNNSQYTNSLQFITNTVEWSLDDGGLMSIRSRGHFNRTLPNFEDNKRTVYEYGTYFTVALLLVLIFVARKIQERSQRKFLSTWVISTIANPVMSKK